MKKDKLEALRHSTSHVLAQAVKELFPNVKLGIGPTIEDGFYYDFDKKDGFSKEDLDKIEKRMQEIINKDLKIKKIASTNKKAKEILKNEPYKLDILNELKGKITFYQQGNFIDLCKGPHIKSTGEIKAFKLLKIAGAYWKGLETNPMLTRIYGTAFFTKEELQEFIRVREEAEKRDHRKIGKQLDLFSFHDEAPGFVFWHNKGSIIWNEIESYLREKLKDDYIEVKTPLILRKELWETSGHWDHYKENMYFTKIDNKDFAVRPMNCPSGILVYKNSLHSYKELPLRVTEFGIVHRHELSGVLSGLFRVRKFTQDDAHIYCLPDQIKEEIKKLINLIKEVYTTFGFKEYHIELSTRPKNSIGTDQDWNKATKALKDALKERKLKYKLNEGEGAFYGPKVDFHIKDCIGRTWQCGTIQVDFSMPQRFNLTYEGEDGRKHVPVMIHRTIIGSFERFIGILIEHYNGKFPLWLAPVQVRLLTINDRNKKFANEVKNTLIENEIRVELDDRTESIPKKVRDAQEDKIPLAITIGDKEDKNKTLAIRTLDGKVKFGVKVNDFIRNLLKEIKERKC